MGKTNAVLTVHVWEGKNLFPKDSNGKSDPYCSIYTSPTGKPSKCKTKVKKANLSPVWQEAFNIKLETWKLTTLHLECHDWDRFGIAHDFMGRFSIPISSLEGKVTDKWYTLLPREGKKDQVSGKIRLQLHLKILEDENNTTVQYEDKVNANKFKEMNEDARNKQQILFRFIEAEHLYVAELKKVFELFYSPLKEKQILTDNELGGIFKNLRQIYMLNCQFLDDLQTRQKDDEFVIDVIGDILASHLGKIDCYVTYCVEQYLASETVKSLQTSNSDLEIFLNGVALAAPKSKSLLEYLHLPQGRLKEYRVSISDYLTSLGSNSCPNKEYTQSALDNVIQIQETIDDGIAERAFVQSAQKFYQSVEKTNQYGILNATHGDGSRSIESIASVTVLENGLNVPSLAVLFEECIVFTQQNRKEVAILYEVSLLSAAVNDVPDTLEHQNAIELTTPSNQLILEMPSLEVKMHWLYIIDHLQNDLLYEQLNNNSHFIDEDANVYIEQAQELIMELGDELPIEYVNALEDLLGNIGQSREERRNLIKQIDSEAEKIKTLNKKADQLNKSMAHASGNSDGSFYSMLNYQATPLLSAAESVSTGAMSFLRKKPISKRQNSAVIE